MINATVTNGTLKVLGSKVSVTNGEIEKFNIVGVAPNPGTWASAGAVNAGPSETTDITITGLEAGTQHTIDVQSLLSTATGCLNGEISSESSSHKVCTSWFKTEVVDTYKDSLFTSQAFDFPLFINSVA